MPILLIFITEVLILCFLEKRIWGTYFTPLNFLSFPYTIVTLVAVVYSNFSVGIPDFYYPSLWVWGVGLLIFFLPSLFFSMTNKCKKGIFQIIVSRKDDSYRILTAIAILCIAISFTRIHSVISRSGFSFGSDEFSEEYEVKGVLSHIAVLMSAIFSYMIYKADAKHKFAYVIIILALIGMYAVGVKSWIIAPFLIGYIARIISGKTTFSIKSTLLPIVICVLFFILSYYILMVIAGKSVLGSDWFTFIINHFMNYLCVGTYSLGLDIKANILEPEMTESLFAPLVNIVYMFSGDIYVNPINPIFISIGSLGEGNVRTFLGTIYVYSQDFISFILIVLFFSIFVYGIYMNYRKSSNVYMLLANCCNLAFLSLGFFEFYWLNLSPYEIVVIFLLLSIISRFSLRNAFKRQ